LAKEFALTKIAKSLKSDFLSFFNISIILSITPRASCSNVPKSK